MRSRAVVALLVASLSGFAADWNPKQAAAYLDARQKAWFAWPSARNPENGVCLSCHTGLSYLMARPALRTTLQETQPTTYEAGLLDEVRKRLAKWPPPASDPKAKEQMASQSMGVESVLAALLLATADARAGKLTPDAERAFDRMWALQITSGPAKGAWNWNNFNLDPYEEPESAFFGASLAALAVGSAPAGYAARLQIRANLAALESYLSANRAKQPLHNRLALAWASTKVPEALAANERKAIAQEAIRKQSADGGWTIESLGPWAWHRKAPSARGSNAYATAFTVFMIEQAGVPRTDRNLLRGMDWLRAHQDPQTGAWNALSMNQSYPSGSMQSGFMRDAATSYAVLALLAH